MTQGRRKKETPECSCWSETAKVLGDAYREGGWGRDM